MIEQLIYFIGGIVAGYFLDKKKIPIFISKKGIFHDGFRTFPIGVLKKDRDRVQFLEDPTQEQLDELSKPEWKKFLDLIVKGK